MNTITRRAALRGIAATATATAALAVPAASAMPSDLEAVLEAWRAWRALTEEEIRLNSKLEYKYRMVPAWAQVPAVRIVEKWCNNDDDIDSVCDAAPAWMQPAIPELRKSAKAELADIWRRREALYEKIGLTEMEARQDEIFELRVPHIVLIEGAPGSAPVVVAAKLDLAIASCKEQDHLSDLPQGYICDAMRGLLPELPADMRAKMEPIAAADDIVRNVYWPRPADVPKAGDQRAAS